MSLTPLNARQLAAKTLAGAPFPGTTAASPPEVVKSPGARSLEADDLLLTAARPPRDPQALTSALLYLDAITVSFDGFRALNALSLVIGDKEMRAIIGPNGAGKTTMMDVITGKTRPNTGTALFAGVHDLTALDEASIAQLGIGRKFQTPTVFDMHTVEDNILLAVKADRRAFANITWHRTAHERARVDELLERVRLQDQRLRRAGDLSHGQKQWLEIGMLLAQEPRLLLVDEPAAGMTDQETADTAVLLREIAKTRSVVVVEHDMQFVRDLDVKVTVLHEGAVLAEGPLDQVSADARVIEVYLGR
ncbi:urea ABC transporter ATP-binding protein UrtD [Xanthobacter agilis]|uniref:urea ABC transporter ATP-binding protein UrtD n=1 Tax=Xanthobacter agilis TaxID=47492 RepID=UPI00372B47C4